MNIIYARSHQQNIRVSSVLICLQLGLFATYCVQYFIKYLIEIKPTISAQKLDRL